jgi:AcrR family transcriptional regulator
MPRKPDANLEGRILDAAYRLWSERGERALTMRAVAQAAHTTTPTLYKRFRDKSDLRNFLEERARQNLFAAIKPCRSGIEVCRRALAFISKHRNEYRLLTTGWAERLTSGAPMISLELLQKVLARELGGTPASHKDLGLQLIAQIHGTALLLSPANDQKRMAPEFHKACLRACAELIRQAGSSR